MLFLLRRARQSLHHQSRCRTSSRRNACLLFATTTFVGTRRTVVVVVVPETKASKSFVNLLSGASSSSSSSRSCVGSDDGLCVVFSNALFAAFFGTGVLRRRPRVLLPSRALWQISSVCRRARERERVEYVHRFLCVSSLSFEKTFFFLTHFFSLFFPEQKKKRKKKPMMMCHRRRRRRRRKTHTHTHTKKKVSETGAFIHFATWPFDTVRGVVLTKPRFELGISGSLRTLDISQMSTCVNMSTHSKP